MLKCPELELITRLSSEPYTNYENVKRVKFRKGIKRVNKSLGAKEVKDGGSTVCFKIFHKDSARRQKEEKKLGI